LPGLQFCNTDMKFREAKLGTVSISIIISERLDPTATEMDTFQVQVPRLVTTNSAKVAKDVTSQSDVCSSASCAVCACKLCAVSCSVLSRSIKAPGRQFAAVHSSPPRLSLPLSLSLPMHPTAATHNRTHNAQTRDTHCRFL